MRNLATPPAHDARSMLAAAALAASLAGTTLASGQPVEAPKEAGSPALELRFETIERLVIVPVRIDGSRTLRCVFDTGMPEGVFLFDPALGDELALEYVATVPVRGPGPDTPTARVAVGSTLRLGDVEIANQRVIVLEKPSALGTIGIDGVIGASIFSRYVAQIDFDHATIRLFDPSTFDATGAGEPVPLSIAMMRPLVDVEVIIDGQASIPVRLIVDTARAAISLTENADKGLAAPPKTLSAVVGAGIGGDLRGEVGRIASLRLGSHRLEGLIGRFPEEPPSPAAGVLGIEVLSRFTVTFDYANQRMLLRPGASYGEPFEYNMAGLVVRPVRGDGLRVYDVIDASPAARAGIRTGDMVVAIDGRALDEIVDAQVWRLFERHGATIVLTLERGGERLEVSLELRRLI